MTHQELITALFNWKNEIIEQYLHKGGDPNWTDEYGKSLLHEAAMYENTEAIKILIKAGANIEARDNDGFTPIFWPSKAEPIFALHEAGADIFALDNEGQQPLHVLTMGGHTEAVCALLALGADMYAIPKDTHLPAPYFALYSDNPLGVLSAYKMAGFKEDKDYPLALNAHERGKHEVVLWLKQMKWQTE